MLKHLGTLRRLGVPFVLAALLLFLTGVPVALAHTRLSTTSLIGPKSLFKKVKMQPSGEASSES
jgi:hypothetical protein